MMIYNKKYEWGERMENIWHIYWSPTYSSYKVGTRIVKQLSKERNELDLCQYQSSVTIENGLCVFAMPCYGGRIPQVALQRLQHIRGIHSLAIICVTFGNRDFEDALLELKDSVENLGFDVVGACAIVTEHNIMHVYGTGRPDEQDFLNIDHFVREVKMKIKTHEQRYLELPGQRPYKVWHAHIVPIVFEESQCVQCGLCASQCPMNAISKETFKTNMDLCINCMRCISICPKHCKSLPEEHVEGLIERLRLACQERKDNQFYI